MKLLLSETDPGMPVPRRLVNWLGMRNATQRSSRAGPWGGFLDGLSPPQNPPVARPGMQGNSATGTCVFFVAY